MEPAPGKESSTTHWGIIAVATAICSLIFLQQDQYIFGAVTGLVAGYFLGRMFYASKDKKEAERKATAYERI